MAPKAKLEVAMTRLTEALNERYNDKKSIERSGDKIVIPARMTLPDAAKAISEFHVKQEEVIETRHDFVCHPHDGMVSFYQAVTDTFGELMGEGQDMGFKGKIPGRAMNIAISTTETISVPVGTTAIPGLPIEMTLHPQFDEKHDLGGSFIVVFKHPRKFEPLIKQIVDLTNEKLKKESIFRGKAINSGWEFINLDGFNPEKVIYSRNDERMIEANVLLPIRRTKDWRAAGNRLKRGILLYGPYGTGKTLTALYTAYECVKNGWTFINVRPGDDISKSLRVAKMFAPAVVFFEDIDQSVDGERDEGLNQILNTVDGVVGKNDEVMVVLTTNHIERINPAMLRPGRLDSAIPVGELDDYAIEKLIVSTAKDTFGNSSLEGKLDMKAIMNIAEGYTSAFIVEAVIKAKSYALARSVDQNWKITCEDIVLALTELHPQYLLMRGNVVTEKRTIDSTMRELVEEVAEAKQVMTKEDADLVVKYVKDNS